LSIWNCCGQIDQLHLEEIQVKRFGRGARGRFGPTPDWRAVPRRDALNRILRSHAPAANAGRTRAIIISERAQRARHEGHRPLADDSADRYDAASIVA